MKSIIYFFISLLFITTVRSQERRPNIDQKGGNALLIDKLMMPASLLVWYDRFDDEHSFSPFGKNFQHKSGVFRKLMVDTAKLIVLPIGDQIPFLIRSSDTIIFYNENEAYGMGLPSLKYKSSSKNTFQLKFFETIFRKYGPCFGKKSYGFPRSINNIDGLVTNKNKKWDNINNYLSECFEQKLLDSSFYFFAKDFFRLKYYDELLGGLQDRIFNYPEKKHQTYFYADSIVRFFNTVTTTNYAWQEGLKNYVRLKLDDQNISSRNVVEVLADINTHLYGKSKDFAVFFLFKMLLEKDKLLAYSKSSLFKEYCRDVEYISYIMANLSSTNQTVMNDKEVGENTDELVDIALNEKTLVNIFDSLRGKVIYIDFWASWCIPCLEEMSYSADLLKKYKGTDVVFLFLSLDAFVDKWRRANDVLPKSKMALSFLIRNSETNYFISKYKIQSIPRYMIVDKNGLIMDNDAPRPSEARLSNILVQLTSK